MLRKDILDKATIQLAKQAMNSGVSKESFKEWMNSKKKQKK